MAQRTSLENVIGKVFDAQGAEGVVDYFSFLFGAFVITKDGIVIGANDDFIKLVGYEKSELYGLSVTKLITDDEQAAMKRRFAENDTNRYELKLLPKNQKIKEVLVSPSSFMVQGQIYRLAQFIDISLQSRESFLFQQANRIAEKSNAVLFMWKASRESAAQYVSDNVNLFGYAAGSFYSGEVRYLDLIHPDDKESVAVVLDEKSRSGESDFTLDYRIVCADGKTKWVSDHVSISRTPEGAITQIEDLIVENTEAVLKQQQLQNFQLMVSSTTDMLALIDAEYRYLAANQAYSETFGLSPDEIVGLCVSELYGQDFFSAVLKPNIDRCLAGEEIYSREWYDLPGKGLRFIDSSYSPASEEPRAVMVADRDITDLEKAESKAELGEIKFNSVFKVSALPASIINSRTGEVVAVNDRLIGLLGYSEQETLSNNFLKHSRVADQNKFEEFVAQLSRDKKLQDYPVQLLSKSGEILTVLVSANQIPGEDPDLLMVSCLDVTSRLEAEKNLKDTLKELELASVTAKLGIWELELSTGKLSWNDEMLNIYGISRRQHEENLDGWKKQLHPDDIEFANSRLEKIAQGNTVHGVEYRVIRADGEIRHVEASGTPVRDSDGNIVKLLGINVDVSGFKRALAVKKESESRLIASQELVGLGEYTWDLSSDVVQWSDGLYKLLGYEPTETFDKQKFASEIYYPADRDRVDAWLNEGITTSQTRLSRLSYRLIRKDGEVLYVDSSARIERSDGNPLRVLVTCIDVTSERHARNELLRANQLLLDIGELSKTGGWEVDLQNMGTFFTDETLKIFGLSNEKTPTLEEGLAFFPPDAKLQIEEAYTAAIDRGESFDQELRFVDAHGTKKWVRAIGKPFLKNGKSTRLFGALQDVSSQKAAQLKLTNSLIQTVHAIALTVEKRDPYTAGHMNRVAELSVAIAKEMHLRQDFIDGLNLTATIHDLGKIYIPSEILNRPGKITATEFEIIKTHSQVGYEILEGIDFPWPVADAILQHHERLDGSGYPNGLRGNEICLEAQILAVSDMVEAISSHRPYRAAKGIETGLEIIEQEKGAKLNSEVVDACTKIIREKGFDFSSSF